MAAHLIPAVTDLHQQLIDMNANGRRFRALRNGVSPLTASPEQVAEAGFPPRPDAVLHKELFTVWEAVFTLELEIEQPLFALPFPPAYYNSGSTRASLGRSHYESSSNWSGAYITPRDGQMITQIMGLWNIPVVQVAPGGPAAATYGSSTWIGLDGQRSYFNSTLPQIGTGQFLNLPTAPGSTTEAWVQWWPLCPVTLGLQVVPGDLMLAWMAVLSDTEVLFVLVNISRLRYTPFTLYAPDVKMPPFVPNAVQAKVSGATGEWVMERPAVCPKPDPLTLPFFPPLTFNLCLATTARTPMSGEIEVHSLVSPKLIRLFGAEGDPRRTITRAVAARPPLSTTAATVAYKT